MVTVRILETNLLRDLEQPENESLRHAFSEACYTKGSLVFQPREEHNRIFIVRTGRARVYLAREDKEFTLVILEPGAVFTTHTRAFVQALDDLTLLEADLEAVRQRLLFMPSLTASMVSVLGDLLSCSISIIDSLAFSDVKRRLVEMLLYEARRAPECAERETCGGCIGGSRVELGLTTEQLASIIGSTRQTVSSLVNSLAKEGLLQRDGRSAICIPNLEELEACLED